MGSRKRVARNGRGARATRSIAFGIMGGWNQSQAHAQFVSNVVDHGMNIQAALEAPRFTKLSFDGTDVTIERRIRPTRSVTLRRAGTNCRSKGTTAVSWEGADGDALNAVNYGASDPRKDGSAVPEPVTNNE